MIDRLLAGVALAALAAASAVAQPPAPSAAAEPPAERGAALDPSRLAAAERLIAAMWSDALFAQAFEIALAQEVPGWSAPAPDPRDPHQEERTRLRQQATRTELLRAVRNIVPEIRTLVARFYAGRLSVAELDEATRFYTSPEGRRFVSGSLEMGRHIEALGSFHPEPDPELIAAAMRFAMRVQAETRHLSPPPPPPPPPSSRRERERRGSGRPERRRDAESREREEPVDIQVAEAPPSPPAPAPPPPPPADPARLAAAQRTASAILPDEAFSQPLPVQATLEAVLSLPVSAFVPIMPPGTVSPSSSLGQAAQTFDPHFQERARIVARIASEELPRLLPHVAPLMRSAVAELYARTFTVAELDAVTGFYSTPAGRALARESFTSMFDPEFARGSLLIFPRAAVEVLGAMVRIGQSTVNLPPAPPAPPPPPPPPTAEDDEADEDQDEH